LESTLSLGAEVKGLKAALELSGTGMAERGTCINNLECHMGRMETQILAQQATSSTKFQAARDAYHQYES